MIQLCLASGDDRLEQIAHLQNADDAVNSSAVNRDTRIMRVKHHLERLVDGILDIERHKVDAAA